VLQAIRWALPAAIFAAGVVVLVIRDGDSTGIELFAMTTGASLSVLLVGWLVRIGNSGDAERRAEEDARDYYSMHGRWPDEH
jgi:hypothetical protein